MMLKIWECEYTAAEVKQLGPYLNDRFPPRFHMVNIMLQARFGAGISPRRLEEDILES